jgi:hypothetical protein
MVNGNSFHIGGRAVAVILGVISLIGTFVPNTGIGFFGRVGLFILGVVLIGLGVR